MFFDDILIYSSPWSSHLKHLHQILSVIEQHELYLKRSKCESGTTQIKYLGHIINKGCVAMYQDKITPVLNWPQPKTVRALPGFLGLAGHSRKFVKNFARIVDPLNSLLKKGLSGQIIESSIDFCSYTDLT